MGRRIPQKICGKYFHKKFVENLSTKNLWKTFPQKICGKPFHKKFVENLSTKNLWKTFPQKICGKSFHKKICRKPFHKKFVENLNKNLWKILPPREKLDEHSNKGDNLTITLTRET